MIRTEVVYNNFGAIADRLETQVPHIVEQTTFNILRLAMGTSPWDTRHMINTHKAEFSDDRNTGEVAVYADYGPYVHEGHRTRNGGYVAGRPWLAEAAEWFRPHFNGAIYMVFGARQ